MTSQHRQEALQYPCIISNSSSIFPNYLILPSDGSTITIGREAANDICINASHISRLHAELRFNERGNLEVKDTSRNGISCGEQRLPQDEAVELPANNNVRLDFKGGLVLEILFFSPEKQYSNNDARDTGYHRKNVTEIFFLNEHEHIDNIDDFPDHDDRLNLQPKNDEYKGGQYSLTGNKSASYHNRGQNSLSVFSDLGKKTPVRKHGSVKNGYNFSPQVIAITVVLSLLAIITAILVF